MSADETNRQHPDAYLRRPTFCDNENYPNGKSVYVKELVNTGRVNHLCPGIYSTMKQGTNQRAKRSNVST